MLSREFNLMGEEVSWDGGQVGAVLWLSKVSELMMRYKPVATDRKKVAVSPFGQVAGRKQDGMMNESRLSSTL